MKLYFCRGLSGKLLLLTIIFVMVAEVLIYIPSAALFRQNWLEQRVSSAQLLTLAVLGVPDFQSSKALDEQFMRDTNITAVMHKHDGMTELVLGLPPAADNMITVDLKQDRRLPDFSATAKAYFADDEGYLRVLAEPTDFSGEHLEVLIPQSALKQALHDYGRRVLGLSVLIALVTGLLIYLALSALIVRPVQRLAHALGQFREDPEQRAGNITATSRRDEIGQLEREFVDMKAGLRGALKQKDRLATLGLAVAKINHDLRNVLSTAQLISDRVATDPEERVRAMGQRLVRAIDRGVQLCAATLSYSKSKEDIPQPKTVRLASLLGEAAGDAMGGTNKKVNWINDIPSDLTVNADPDHTYRIFNNLFRNALQAMQSQSGNRQSMTLQVDAKTVTKGDGSEIIVRVIDNGPGLSNAAQTSLFKPFTGSNKGGTGLGLTISRELARAHEGDLRLETTSEAGTIFAVVLPG